MRMTQIIGLKSEALDFLQSKGAVQSETLGETKEGLCGEPVNFSIYRIGLLDYYKEVVQVCPWSSGPCYFLCLEEIRTGKRLFEWSEDEIEKAL